MIIDITLLIFLIISSFTDIAYRKVFNFTTFPAVILGLGFNFFYFGIPGLKDSLAGFAAGFIFLFIFYLLGGIGAGDVKFMAAAGAIKGFNFVIAGGFYGVIIGGMTAIFVLLAKKNLFATVKKLIIGIVSFTTFKTPESLKFNDSGATYLPYTVFLSIGIFLHWLEITLIK